MKVHRRGFTLIEMLAALAIAALLAVGLVQLILSAMADNKGQQAAQHQQRVAAAAAKYLAANHTALAATATATLPARVTVAQLQTAGFLPTSQQPTNAYGQTPCMLVLEPSAGKLEALLVTEGSPIPVKELGFVAANAGAGAGYIPAGSPLVARGAFDSWRLTTTELSRYLSTSCTGTPAAGGGLATALFADGTAQADFLYRGAVSGHPELNRMTAPLHMAATAVEGATDARCLAADPTTHGRIAVDAGGRVLSCQAGVWKGQGSAFWKDPVRLHADLPAAGNNAGDVRMVTALSRAFTWSGSGWVPLAVDETGNLSVPGTLTTGTVQLNTTVVKNQPCPTDGLLGRDAAGLPLACSGGSWRALGGNRVTGTALEQTYTFTPADGIQNFWLDLTPLPGSRPLYVTGYTYCNSSSSTRAWAVVEPYDAAGNRLGYSGGCGARSSTGQGRVMTKGVIALSKLPDNTASLHIYMEPGAVGEDFAHLRLVVQNGE